MTSEKRLREIAKDHAKEQLQDIETLTIIEADEDEELSDRDCERVEHLVRTWPILDLPEPDRDGRWFPEHGLNYGHIRCETVKPILGFPFSRIVISRGGPGEVSRHTSMTLTRDEALELAGILTAAAMEEA